MISHSNGKLAVECRAMLLELLIHVVIAMTKSGTQSEIEWYVWVASDICKVDADVFVV